MTCIVGLIDGNEVVMGADSAGVSGWDLTLRADSKVFIVSEFLIGFTTSFRMGQLLRYRLSPPPRSAGVRELDLVEYMTTLFVDEVRRVLKEGGYAEKDKERESMGDFMVGVNGRLFILNSDYQVGESIHEFGAIGCGGHYAIGAMAASHGVVPAEKRVGMALQVAEDFSAGVRAPFNILRK